MQCANDQITPRPEKAQLNALYTVTFISHQLYLDCYKTQETEFSSTTNFSLNYFKLLVWVLVEASGFLSVYFFTCATKMIHSHMFGLLWAFSNLNGSMIKLL